MPGIHQQPDVVPPGCSDDGKGLRKVEHGAVRHAHILQRQPDTVGLRCVRQQEQRPHRLRFDLRGVLRGGLEGADHLHAIAAEAARAVEQILAHLQQHPHPAFWIERDAFDGIDADRLNAVSIQDGTKVFQCPAAAQVRKEALFADLHAAHILRGAGGDVGEQVALPGEAHFVDAEFHKTVPPLL